MYPRLTVEELLRLKPSAYPYERKKIGTVKVQGLYGRDAEDFYEYDKLGLYGRLTVLFQPDGSWQDQSPKTHYHVNLMTYEESIGIPGWKLNAVARHRNDEDRTIYEYLFTKEAKEYKYNEMTGSGYDEDLIALGII